MFVTFGDHSIVYFNQVVSVVRGVPILTLLKITYRLYRRRLEQRSRTIRRTSPHHHCFPYFPRSSSITELVTDALFRNSWSKSGTLDLNVSPSATAEKNVQSLIERVFLTK